MNRINRIMNKYLNEVVPVFTSSNDNKRDKYLTLTKSSLKDLSYRITNFIEQENEPYNPNNQELLERKKDALGQTLFEVNQNIKRLRVQSSDEFNQKFIEFRNSMQGKIFKPVVDFFWMDLLGVKTYKNFIDAYSYFDSKYTGIKNTNPEKKDLFIKELLKSVKLLEDWFDTAKYNESVDLTDDDLIIHVNQAIKYFDTECRKLFGSKIKYKAFVDKSIDTLILNVLEDRATSYYSKVNIPDDVLLLKFKMELHNDDGEIPNKFEIYGSLNGIKGINEGNTVYFYDSTPAGAVSKLINWIEQKKEDILNTI